MTNSPPSIKRLPRCVSVKHRALYCIRTNSIDSPSPPGANCAKYKLVSRHARQPRTAP